MLGLYIHFPFCVQKCNYCDFLSGPISSRDVVQDYLQALEKELTIYHDFLKRDGNLKLETIYLGGGTPSLLETHELVRVLEKCRDLFNWSPQMEVTLEANPGTVDIKKLVQLKKAGLNRLSFGVQSFDQNLLASMGRIHSPKMAKESIMAAKEAGFKNISLDLMYGLPEQSLGQWEETLVQTIELDVQHISVYGLKVEEGTVWGEWESEGRLSLPEEDVVLTMRKYANKILRQAGFVRYEISNYARPGYESRHNLGYWTGKPYLGLGLGASSDYWNRRFVNTSNMEHYIFLLKRGQLPVTEEEILSFRQRMGETIFLGLRLSTGLDLEQFKNRYGVDIEVIYGAEIEKLKKMGLLKINQGHLQLTTKAVSIANYVFTFFV
ncbi:MAG: radical SAM family heme chaperone HemW [Zhaonellaceae bacterium]|jgi:oxygen-independent coproporphyrinogen-3 oxidase